MFKNDAKQDQSVFIMKFKKKKQQQKYLAKWN